MISDKTLGDLTAEYLRAAGLGGNLTISRDRREYTEGELSRVADVLPEPDVWTVQGRERDARALLLAGSALLTVAWAEESPYAPLAITFRQVRLADVLRRRDDRKTHWTFRFRDGHEVTIEGEMDYRRRDLNEPEQFDQAEAFARVLADRGGWPIDT